MNAIDLLKKDHQKVAGLFKEYERASDDALSEKEKLFRQIKQELDLHARIEEEIFYPAAREIPAEEAQDLVNEADEEHRQIKTLLAELDGTDADDEQYDAKMKVLKEDVEHHVEEEQDELFPKVKKGLGRDRLEQLGGQLEARKRALTVEVEPSRVQTVRRATVPRSSAQTSRSEGAIGGRDGAERGSITGGSTSGSRGGSQMPRRGDSSSDSRDDAMASGARRGSMSGRSRSSSSRARTKARGGARRSTGMARGRSRSRGRR